MRFHACLLALIALVIAAFSPPPALARDRALVIGVNIYPLLKDKFGNLGGLNLRGSTPDAHHFADLLVDVFGFRREDIKVMTDHEATRQAIVEAFRIWLIEGTEPGDRAVFYFSGHGSDVAIRDPSGGKRLTSGIVPTDRDPSVNPASAGPGGLILGPQLGALIDELKGRQVMVVADSCHSGSVTRDPDAAPAYELAVRTITPSAPLEVAPGEITDEMIREAKTSLRLLDFNARGGTPRDNVAVWSAATIAQVTFDAPDGNGGVFTNNLIAGLREMKADRFGKGEVTAAALLAYAREEAQKFCDAKKGRCPDGLTPELLAPEAYFASVLVPYRPAEPVATAPSPAPAPPPPTVEPTGPALVNLAEGVLSHANDFALSAEILPGVRIRLGEAVRFRIDSAEEGQLVVLDTGADGKIRRIYPNEYSEAAGRKGLIRAAAPLTIPDESYPFEFTADEGGPGTLIVLVAEKGVDIGPLLAGDAFEPAKDIAKALIAVAADLAAPAINPSPDIPNGAHRWAFVTVPYHVSP